MMILQVILEGIGLGVLLILVCAIGIRKGAVGMVHLWARWAWCIFTALKFKVGA